MALVLRLLSRPVVWHFDVLCCLAGWWDLLVTPLGLAKRLGTDTREKPRALTTTTTTCPFC